MTNVYIEGVGNIKSSDNSIVNVKTETDISIIAMVRTIIMVLKYSLEPMMISFYAFTNSWAFTKMRGLGLKGVYLSQKSETQFSKSICYVAF